MESAKPLYTLLLDPDKTTNPDHLPIIMETDVELATLKHMRILKKRHHSGLAFTAKIAQVTINDLDNVEPACISAALLLPDDKRVDDLIGLLHEVASEHGLGLPIDQECHLAQMRLTILQWIRTL